MHPADSLRVDAFLHKWQGSEGNERANYQTFLGDLCGALGVEGPPPKGTVEGDPYCFDKDIKFYRSDKTAPSTKFADFYKEHCFLLEAKQGSTTSGKGHGKRGTKAYRDTMQKAFNQAKAYAYNRKLSSKPPFLITCDIGSHFELWEGFSGEYGSYGARQRVNLADLAQPEVFDRFVKIFTDPQALNPEKYRARVTREVAAELATLSRWLEQQGHDPQETANFLMRCIFTMFAEDVELLKGEMFTKALRDRWIANPNTFQPEIETLWQTMNTGGNFGFERVLRFNGSFFENARAIPLPKEQLEVLYAAAAKDWSQVEPAIFGTLLERALEKKERSRLGAHYTPRSYVERLVRPVVMEPLRQEWDEIEIELKRLLEPEPGKEDPTANQRKKAEQEIRAFLDKLRTIKILDPACGTGNFLYVSLDLLKGLEAEVITRLVDVAGQVQLNVLEQINPSQFLGIEINPRAAAIAELVIWIGYLQWYFKRFGNAEPPEPVLQAFGNIENRDAVLAYDGKEPDVDPKTGKVRTRWGGRMMTHPVTGEEVPDPTDQVEIYRYLNPCPAEWPEADYVVSNPPFIGNKRMKKFLGDGYVEILRETYKTIPETADYVVYWLDKSAHLLTSSDLTHAGFITTNSIVQPFNNKLIQKHVESDKGIFLSFAVPDHPWVDAKDGADVRISMIAMGNRNHKYFQPKFMQVISEAEGDSEINPISLTLRQSIVPVVNSNLSIGVDVASAIELKANQGMAFTGMYPLGQGFIVSPEDLSKACGNDQGTHKVVKPFFIARDITQKNRLNKAIDFYPLTESEAKSNYPSLYQWVLERVKPQRDQNNRESRKRKWWLFAEPVPALREALKEQSRFILIPRTAKFFTFNFVAYDSIPDTSVVAVVSDDSYILGVLSSQIHLTWAVESGGRLGVGNDTRYQHKRTFNPFPFPDATPEQKQKIRDLGERLDAHRKQVQAAHPDITITGMYNLLEKLRAGEPFTDKDRDYNNRALVSTLKQIHDELDAAVLDAYGWEDLMPLLSPSPRLGEGLGERANATSLPHPPTPSPRTGEGESDFPSPKLGEGPGVRANLDEIILERLVALNAQRAEEERNGIIRWLRPEYQAPDQSPLSRSGRGAGGEGIQGTLPGTAPPTDPVIEPVEQQKWPTQPKDQLAAIRDLLRTTPGDWSAKQIAAQFKGRTTQKKLDAITENLERLEWFGLVIAEHHDGLTTWQYTDPAKAA